MSENTQRKLAAIVSADVVGYSRVAMTLSLPKDASVHDLVQPTRHYLRQSTPSAEVAIRGSSKRAHG